MSAKESAFSWKHLIARMKENKKFEAAVYITLLLIGLLIYLLIPNGETVMGKAESKGENVAKTPAGATVERQLEETLGHMRGVGDVEVMLTYRDENTKEEVYGVIVIAEGAENLLVKSSIQSAVQTVLNVEASRINVFEMGTEEAK